MAEGVFRSVTSKPPYSDCIRKVDSCGTGAYHVGDNPDDRTMDTLEEHGITDYRHKARKVRHNRGPYESRRSWRIRLTRDSHLAL